MAVKFRLKAIVDMKPVDSQAYFLKMSGCSVLEYSVKGNIPENFKTEDFIEWNYPEGVIEKVYKMGCREGKFSVDTEVEVSYHADYWEQSGNEVRYANFAIKAL